MGDERVVTGGERKAEGRGGKSKGGRERGREGEVPALLKLTFSAKACQSRSASVLLGAYKEGKVWRGKVTN